MDVKALSSFLEDFYGYKIKRLSLYSNENKVLGILYDSFWLQCSCNNKENKFEAVIYFGDINYVISEFFGKIGVCSIDAKKIKKILQIIDDYCRLRLPDKFLEAHYKAYVLSLYEDYNM